MEDVAAGEGGRKRKDGENGAASSHEQKRRRWDASPGEAAASNGAADAAPAPVKAAPTAAPAAKPLPLSLDALAKAKKALQMQKELNEKLKKLPQLQKPAEPAALVPVAPAAVPAAPAAPAAPGPPSAAFIAAAAAAAGIPVQLPPSTVPASALSLAAAGVPGSGVVSSATPSAGAAAKPAAAKAPILRLDAMGREIDEEGNVVERPKFGPVSTLKVNINKAKKEAFKILRPDLEPEPEDNPFYDPRMQSSSRKKLVRARRSSFQFVEEGAASKQAELMRIRAHFGEARAKEAAARRAAEEAALAAAAQGDEGEDVNLIPVGERPKEEERKREPIPNVEWWDAALLNQPSSYTGGTEGVEGEADGPHDAPSAILKNLKESKITLYVEHPVPIEPPAEPAPPPPQPLRLTSRERKKLRTQKRVAREKERQEMVRQGLLEAPKPKVKMSNLMRVLANEATQDPTKMEKEVRAAAAEREQAHADRNLARMLTPAERKDKKERKLFEDGLLGTGGETFVSVFKIGHLLHPQTRYKVDINAQENRLTGCVVLADTFCLVVVEGGQKSIKRYSKLMTRRINWATATAPGRGDDDADDSDVNYCKDVWQGTVAKPTFQRFTIEQCRTAAAARKFLQDRGVVHYWDAALNFHVD